MCIDIETHVVYNPRHKGGLYALKTDTMEGHTQYSNLYYFKNYKNYKNTKEFKRYCVD